MPPRLPPQPLGASRNTSRIVNHSQKRHATLIKRPKRPYTFTQLVTLSDGSAFLQRTTSPAPIYRSNKDTRNTMLWNPSSQKLLSVEEDEAGRLRAFRARFGRGWDAASTEDPADSSSASSKGDKAESLIDLISGSAGAGAQSSKSQSSKAAPKSDAKKK